jgi:hypothetical protein
MSEYAERFADNDIDFAILGDLTDQDLERLVSRRSAIAENYCVTAPLQGAKMAPKASDTLTLTAAQQETAWNDLYMSSLNQNTPAGFDAKVGAALPTSVTTGAVTTKASRDVPALKPYRFAMVQKKLVIVNPSDHKIAEVIAR